MNYPPQATFDYHYHYEPTRSNNIHMKPLMVELLGWVHLVYGIFNWAVIIIDIFAQR